MRRHLAVQSHSMWLVIVNEHETCQAIESREENTLRILSFHPCLLYQHLGQDGRHAVTELLQPLTFLDTVLYVFLTYVEKAPWRCMNSCLGTRVC